jgi:decaprenylphospho-beta-D-ribofuranose 2-oxidase
VIVERFASFGRCASGHSTVERPKDLDEVRAVFDRAIREHRHVTIRGGGHSFDGQALHDGDTGSQIVLRTDSFTRIDFGPGPLVTVGAGAKWGDILEQSIMRGLIPAIIQTAREATAGGTLAGDCLSRFSGALGKESAWIESFTLVSPGHAPLRCSRTDNTELFHAAIGGHGYLGFVTDITYRLLEILPGSVARTEVTTFRSLPDLLDAQIPRALEVFSSASSIRRALVATRVGGAASPLQATPDIRALSSVAFQSGPLIKGAVFESFYAQPGNPPLPPFPLYNNLDGGLRYAAELAARNDQLNRLFHESLFSLLETLVHSFQDDIAEFSFFMDGNTFAKRRFEREHPGRVFPITQQTFVIPDRASAVHFVNECLARMAALDVEPTEMDILFVAEDECLMSATFKQSGFAISLAFENYQEPCPPAHVDALLRGLSTLCGDIGGRIHLVKNLRAQKVDVRRMFDATIREFEKIKAGVDPAGILRNPFFDKIF